MATATLSRTDQPCFRLPCGVWCELQDDVDNAWVWFGRTPFVDSEEEYGVFLNLAPNAGVGRGALETCRRVEGDIKVIKVADLHPEVMAVLDTTDYNLLLDVLRDRHPEVEQYLF